LQSLRMALGVKRSLTTRQPVELASVREAQTSQP
jgi:hypothetical protein